MGRAILTSATAGCVLLVAALGLGGRLAGPAARADDGPGAGKAAREDAAPARPQEPRGGPHDFDPRRVDRAKLPDSFKYYGPNGLWARWDSTQKLGRDTWIFSTYGNQKFYRILGRFGGSLGLSIDFYRLLDSRRRGERFKEIGLINEPNFQGGTQDEWGFYVDKWLGDPIPEEYPRDPRWYGEPTGIIGLRMFPNPAFTPEMARAWKADPAGSVRRYLEAPGKVEPPRVVGITCALCHIAFDPLNPPKDPASPRWENLAANLGNQYLREGDLFFGKGRVAGGGANPRHPGPDGRPDDPYDTEGLKADSFLYQYGHTQQPGTSETSRFSYDFINNPNTINQIFYIGNRAPFHETTRDGVKLITNHILKDGADSIGLIGALLRVPINIGAEGDYWADHLWNPATGEQQKPFSIREVKLEVPEARRKELRAKYPEIGEAWKENERRAPAVASYLASYTPYHLADIRDDQGRPRHISRDADQLRRGALVFADQCARCHSNKQPFYPLTSEDDRRRFFRELVTLDQFPVGNTFSDDVRYPFNEPGLGINAARAMATNAVDGDIWADFSSTDYKALPALRFLTFENPLNKLDPARYGNSPMVTEFVAPGGGRGYYRTAALNSMWTSAPFLHNNSVGKQPLGPDGELDPRYITVEGRLELFESAMDELLNPEKRPLFIKVTSADSTLTAGMPALKEQVASIVRDLAREKLSEVIRRAVGEVVAAADVPAELKPTLAIALQDLADRLAPELEKAYGKKTLEEVKQKAVESVREKADAFVAEKLGDRPALRELVGKFKPKFEQVLSAEAADLKDLLEPDVVIPKGTPLNLLLNLHSSKFPYALKAIVKLKHDHRALAEALLRLSECPDLVENRGHTYGSELSSQEKRDLIEYLKTL
ncbi:hypothetical protein OJF2_45180 [Aquisphaera giovannonii]|uniref:Cytochrome c domain-containing protein n=1 Tax=Aquisphaera giovannonii TaxID=406548 RepID=A0A5B9W7G8_9BACT|nr:hypothetical protein [Aquisphaera giovannonii]QEH35961.1 hypothetical protein OJF2_45180 [Aquisphaera giovannonii]